MHSEQINSVVYIVDVHFYLRNKTMDPTNSPYSGDRSASALKGTTLQMGTIQTWKNWPRKTKQKLTDLLAEEVENIKLKFSCKVCFENLAERVFQPCGHLTCCRTCANQLKDCPICRTRIDGLVIVVFPKCSKKRINHLIDFDLLLKKNKYFGITEREQLNSD